MISKTSWLPLYLKKKPAKYTRGLSSDDTEKLKDLPNIYTNPIHVPERAPHYNSTIVWDLDQTLVSADGLKGEKKESSSLPLVIRPRAYEILQILKRNEDVEFIIWTAGNKAHAKRVAHSFVGINFDYIICRHSSWYDEDDPTKGLESIANQSRPIDSIALVDDRMDIGKKHPNNLLIVPKYEPEVSHGDNDATLLYAANILQRAINMYRINKSRPLNSYFYGPLTQKCKWKKSYYWGVYCFKNNEELEERIKKFD